MPRVGHLLAVAAALCLVAEAAAVRRADRAGALDAATAEDGAAGQSGAQADANANAKWWGHLNWEMDNARWNLDRRVENRNAWINNRNDRNNELQQASQRYNGAHATEAKAEAEFNQVNTKWKPVHDSRVALQKQREQMLQKTAAAKKAAAEAEKLKESKQTDADLAKATAEAEQASIKALKEELPVVAATLKKTVEARAKAANNVAPTLRKLRQDIAKTTVKLQALRSKRGKEAGATKAQRKALLDEEKKLKGDSLRARTIAAAHAAAMKTLSKKVSTMESKYSKYQDALRVKLNFATAKVDEDRRAHERAKADVETKMQAAVTSRKIAEKAAADTSAKMESLRKAHAALVAQRNAEQKSMRDAMAKATKAAAAAQSAFTDAQEKHKKEMDKLADKTREAVAAGALEEKAYGTNRTMRLQQIEDAKKAEQASIAQLEAAKQAHETVKANLITARQRAEEETKQLQFRIQQEEIAYESVRKRLQDQRDAAVADMARMQADHKRAEISFNATMARLEAARGAAEGALATSEETMKKERKETRKLLAHLAKEASEAAKKFDAEIDTTKRNQHAEMDALNANLTALTAQKTQLATQIRTLAADKLRFQKDQETIADKLAIARKELMAKEGDKRGLQVAVAHLEEQAKAAETLTAELQATLNTAARRLSQAKADAADYKQRRLATEKKIADLHAQKEKAEANADAIAKAMASIRVSGSSDSASSSRAVADALFKLGQQLEGAQQEKARIEENAAAIEKDIAELTASKAALDSAVAALGTKVNGMKALGVAETGSDGPLASVRTAQAAVDAAHSASSKKEYAATQRRSDAKDERERAVAGLLEEIKASRAANSELQVQLAAVRGGALPPAAQAMLDAAKKELAEATKADDAKLAAELARKTAEAAIPKDALSTMETLAQRLEKLQKAHEKAAALQKSVDAATAKAAAAEVKPRTITKTRMVMHGEIAQVDAPLGSGAETAAINLPNVGVPIRAPEGPADNVIVRGPQ